MTLVLTIASRYFVLQVSDRMLSANRVPLYPASNKTVVVLARDGMYTMSYTGLARIGAIETDDWMARTIAGVVDWGLSPPAWLMQHRLPQWLDVGQGVRAITDGLDEAFRRDVSPAWRRYPHQAIALAGWQWKQHGSFARPVMWSIGRQPHGRFTAHSEFPRHHYGSGFWFSAMPRNSTLQASELQEVVEALRGGIATDADSTRQLFVDTIRLAASRRPRVIGPHCMTVLLYPPKGEIRFIPDPALTEARPLPGIFNDPRLGTTAFIAPAPTGDRREAAPADAAYSPWLIVGDHLVVSHTLVQRTASPFIYSRGQFEFHVGGDT
jgi:hypothetical protein